MFPALDGKLQRWHCTLLTALPAYTIAFFYRDVDALAGFTGGYAGVFIQLVIPAMLVLLARRFEDSSKAMLGPNPHSSPFRSDTWPKAVLAWAVLCLVVNTTFNVLKWRGVLK